MERDGLDENNDVNTGHWVDEELAKLGPANEWQPDMGRGLALLREHHEPKVHPSRRWLWATAAALAACVSVMATPVTRAFAARCVSACVNETSWVRQFLRIGDTSQGPSDVFLKPADRRMAPDFTLNDIAGQPVRLSDFRGRVVLLNFWATWCAPCRVEIPMFIGFEESYRQGGLVVLGLSVDGEGWKVVRPYVDAKKINYPVMIADDKTQELFGGLNAVPTTFIIDRQGRIAATHIGLCQSREYEGDIKAVLAE